MTVGEHTHTRGGQGESREEGMECEDRGREYDKVIPWGRIGEEGERREGMGTEKGEGGEKVITML